MSGGTGAVPAPGTGASDASPAKHGSGPGTAVQNWPHVSFLELAALTTAVPCGRLHARHVLWEWRLAHLAQDAELLVSEMLSNAIKASRPPAGTGLVALRLLANHQQLLIEIWDHNPDGPPPRQAGPESESGRGLTVIEALSDRWGLTRVHPNLKVIWCELAISGQTQPPEHRDATTP
jgi:anti-sigma regulatory factor (Ser/Thr protein kinase)